MKKIILLLTLCICSGKIFSQDITNTLGAGGLFKVKDATTDFLTLNQSNGTITLPLLFGGIQQGSIFKGTDRFLHTYYGTGTDGNNTFLGIQAGNFTMGGVNTNEGSYNTGVGYRSLSSNSTGHYNSAFGVHSLYYNTTGYDNSAFGLNALLFNNTGNGNSAFGNRSLYSNVAGINNTAVGLGALSSNHSGNNATAVGYQAMFYTNNSIATFDNSNVAVGYEALRGSTTPANNTGNSNTAVGYMPLRNNSSGNYNSAFGFSSLIVNSTGSDNSAFGSYSLNINSTGYENSAFGRSSLYANTTGFCNSAFGTSAGSFISSGSNLTCIGYNAQPTSGSATNQITLGNNQITSLRCNVTSITSLSDARDKKNIKDLTLGIDFLMKIKPRLFNWDKREWYEENISDGSKMKEEPTAGFIAQELDELQKVENVEWMNLVLKDNPEKWEATPGNLLPVMLKAIQELKTENNNLKSEIENLNLINDELAEIQNLKTELIQQINLFKSDSKAVEITFTSIEKQPEIVR